uniref:histone deacetylase n=1 Tax=Oryza punctata TaxID=4537 RepID=A0A0E0MDK8_ORYPU
MVEIEKSSSSMGQFIQFESLERVEVRCLRNDEWVHKVLKILNTCGVSPDKITIQHYIYIINMKQALRFSNRSVAENSQSMATGGNSLPSPSCADDKKRRVCYYYDPGIAHIKFSDDHVMVPARVAMAHSLVGVYGMLGDMRRLRTRPATEAEIRRFHSPEYVDLLRDLTPESYANDAALRQKAEHDHGIGLLGGDDDCPAFDRLWKYCRGYAGGSLAAARALVDGASDIAINWSGGMHHACAGKASGFCYVNDIVLAINELLDSFRRVIYVDIDAHHGDGVQNAFLDSNRVMTLSFHRYGKIALRKDFFPGSGAINEVGVGAGEHYSVNVPLDAGVRDDGYHTLFKPIVGKAMEVFQPEAIVLQCGADSLSGDRLGGMELSVRGHAECVSFLRGFNLPLLLVGGGGYTINHVASTWCYETAVAVGKERELPDDIEIPRHGYEMLYKNQGNKLHYQTSTATARKKSSNMEVTKGKVLEHLSQIELAPSVQFQERRGNNAAGVDAGGDLYYERAPSLEDDEPAQRLHRLCFPGLTKRIKLS